MVGGTAFAQGSAVLTGTVIDAATKQPVADVVVTATSPSLQGEQVVVTDATGLYRIPQLPAGAYTMRLEKEAYRPYSRGDINLRTDTTTRVNVEMLPEAIKGEEIVVVGRAPTVDVASTTTGVNVSSDFIRNIAVVRPGGKGSAARSFESLATIAPGAQTDTYGVSISGTTSPENQYVIDGLSVNDPGFGLNATPLSVDFVQEVNVITGGYMPEFGRATGGIMNVVTKSGSNEFHGSVWGNLTPGLLEGERKTIPRSGTTIRTDEKLWNLGDVGAELGGPILKDKLWFFVGVAPSFTRNGLTRTLNKILLNPDGTQRKDDRGFTLSEPIPDTSQLYFADQRSLQYIAKLTYLINQDHNLSLSVYGTPTVSGSKTSFGISPQTGGTEIGNILGPFNSLAHIYADNSTDVSAKLASSFLDKRLLLDVTLGWHHQDSSTLPVDGSKIGDVGTLAAIPAVTWARSRAPAGFHTLADFETLPASAQGICEVAGQRGVVCPVPSYFTGGPGFLGDDKLDRVQGRVVGTYLLTALGHHVLKAGVDIESTQFHRIKAYSGTVAYRESSSGNSFQDFREYGYLVGPDQAVVQTKLDSVSKSTTLGGFVQDSWSVLDLVTLNAGVRYDSQFLWGGDNKLALTFLNQVSPRVGLVYDFTQQGRSKLFANYARFYENAVLDMVDRQFPGERQLVANRSRVANAARPGCDPRDPANQCSDKRNLIAFNGDPAPNTYYGVTGGDKSPVDPNIRPQSSDEFVVGGEYEVFSDARAGISYTKRYLNDVVEDMSRDEATTYFIGNPGKGIASDFPAAVRNYDAVTVYLNKNFSDLWLAQVSYTWSYNRGNYAGLFRPDTGQLDPNITSDFDLISLLDNRTGPLPSDRTHYIKFFGSKEFVLSGATSLSLGLSYTGRSGAALSVYGRHPIYGNDEVYVLPRGSAGRLPWVHNFDGHIGFNYKLSKDNLITVSADVFNIFNFQQVTSKDQRYTTTSVNPLHKGDCKSDPCTTEDLGRVTEWGTTTLLAPESVNPNYGQVNGYQAARSIRFGARVTF